MTDYLEFEKPLMEIPSTASDVTLDGIILDGGTGIRYGTKSIGESMVNRHVPLLRMQRARNLTIQNCFFLKIFKPKRSVFGLVF